MATIKDIAMLANVSHGTVSNVLNKKGNVSAEKIRLVEEAARKLGYKVNIQAKELRKGAAKRVCFLVPSIENKYYRDLFDAMNDILGAMDYDVAVYYTNNRRNYEKKMLEKAVSSNPSTIVLVSSFLENDGVFGSDVNLIFVDRKVKSLPEQALFVSFDFAQAGYEMAQRCIADGKKHVAILCGNSQYSNYKSFIHSAEDALNGANCPFQVFIAEQVTGMNQAFEIMADEELFDAVIVTDIEYVEALILTYRYRESDEHPVIYAIDSKGVGSYKGIVQYGLNYKLCGRKIAKYILKTDMGMQLDKSYLKMKNDGFYPVLKMKKWETSKWPLTFLTLKGPVTDALRLLLPDFIKRTGIQVKLLEDEYLELYASVKDSANSLAYDLLRMDVLWLPQLAEKVLLPMDAENEAIKDIVGKISHNVPDDYFKVGKQMYSLPLDPSVQLLFYQKELFEDALNKREFFERYKHQLEIPKNYTEYNEVAEFFTREYNAQSPTEYGSVLVYGSAITAACDFLPRIRAEGISVFDSDGNIKIDTPDIRRILHEYLNSANYAAKTVHTWWHKAIRQFAQGEVAMMTVFSNYASLMMSEMSSQVTGNIGFAAVPGGSPLLGGGVVGIAKNSTKQRECMEFLRWLYDEETTLMIIRLGGYINTKELLNNVDLLKMYPWVEGMEKDFAKGGRKAPGGTSRFDEQKFEEILGYAVRASATGIMSAEEALAEAQQKYSMMLE